MTTTPAQDQYARLPRRLLESPVLLALNANEWRALTRLLLEHQRHSGFVNDGLPVTTNDFVCGGIGRKYVTSALRVLEALGLVECTRRMQGANSGRLPNLYRPTFLPTSPRGDSATFDFERFKTVDEAKRTAESVRTSDKRIDRGKKRIAVLHRLPNRNPTEGA
jgi:hypothetical protein